MACILRSSLSQNLLQATRFKHRPPRQDDASGLSDNYGLSSKNRMNTVLAQLPNTDLSFFFPFPASVQSHYQEPSTMNRLLTPAIVNGVRFAILICSRDGSSAHFAVPPSSYAHTNLRGSFLREILTRLSCGFRASPFFPVLAIIIPTT